MINQIIKGNQNTTKLIAELKKASKQYPPLSKEEEEALIKQNRHDRAKLNDLLFMHNVRLVFNVAKKYMSKTNDFDAMVQDGMLGLAIAANNFDIDRNVKFITYATPWVRKKILERFYSKANEVIKRSTSLNSPLVAANSKVNDNDTADFESYVNEYMDPSCSNEMSIRHQLSANEQSEICANLYRDLENDSTLSSLEKKIFTDIFRNKEKSLDIQLKYSVDAKQISIIKAKILAEMRKKLESEYGIHSFSDIYDC